MAVGGCGWLFVGKGLGEMMRCFASGWAVVWVMLVLFFVGSSVCAEEVVVRPRPQAGPLDNPLKGWCPYTNAGDIHQPYSMVFQYVSWRELEPEQGQFRFAEWEKKWEVAAAQGKHILFRIYIDYPSLPSGLPDWVRKAGVIETPYTDHGGGLSPDYDDPRMIAAMEQFIAALGDRYNKNPRIAFVQVGMLGFWGEWHTWPREKMYASKQTEQKVIQAFRKAFPDKSLMVRNASGFAGEQDWIGFHDDMFPEDTDNGKDWSFLAGLRAAGRTANWEQAVIGGEMVPGKAKQWLGTDFDRTLAMLNRSHFTWVGPYCPALDRTKSDVFRQRSQELVRKMGYEFQIDEAAHPATVQAKQPAQYSMSGQNLGVAPFYYPWSVEWALLDSSGALVQSQQVPWDIRTWKPGKFKETEKIAFDVPPGSYSLAIGIRDPWQDRPAIRFANELPVVKGWTVLSQIEVTPGTSNK